MAYKKQFAAFSTDKYDFFASVTSLQEARARAKDKNHNYGFVATNEKLIREEFDLLFNRLKQEDVDQDIFWFYCYYNCLMLLNYHRAYRQKAKADEYLKLLVQIRERCVTGKFPSERKNNEYFIAYLARMIAEGLVDWVTTITKTSKTKERVAFLNLSRIYWFFCRTMVSKSFVLARDIDLIDRVGSVLGKKIDVDSIISNLEVPNSVLRFLSVGFFATRFIINAGLIIKHVFLPSAAESKLAWYKRLGNEVYKRHGEILNDLVWGSVNLVTNYNEYFNIAAPTAGWIVAGFLLFDFALIVWRRFLAKREFEIKLAQLTSDRNYYKGLLRREPKNEIYHQQCHLLHEEIKLLKINWKAKSKTFWFNASAALLLMAGFSFSMIFSPPAIILACYILCTFAVAMYLSDAAYNKYKEKSYLLKDAQFENMDYEKCLAEYKEARNDFYLTLARNFIMPALTITLYAVCWQAAVALTALYLAYKLYESYSEFSAKQAKDNEEETPTGKGLKVGPATVDQEEEVAGSCMLACC